MYMEIDFTSYSVVLTVLYILAVFLVTLLVLPSWKKVILILGTSDTLNGNKSVMQMSSVCEKGHCEKSHAIMIN